MFQNTAVKVQKAVAFHWIKREYKKTHSARPSCLTLFYVLLVLKNKIKCTLFKKFKNEFMEIQNLQIKKSVAACKREF